MYVNVLLPFTPEVWLAVIVTAGLGCLLAHTLFRAGQHWFGKDSQNKEALYFFAIIFCQARPRATANVDIALALKLLMIFWLAYTFFVEEMFSCNLRANLVSKKHEEATDTFDDIVDQNRHLFFIRAPLMWARFRHLKVVATSTVYPPARSLPKQVVKGVLQNGSQKRCYSKKLLKSLISMTVSGACWLCDSLEVSTLTYQHMKYLSTKGQDVSQAARLFQVGKKVLLYDYSAFIFPKGEPCREEINSVLGKLV